MSTLEKPTKKWLRLLLGVSALSMAAVSAYLTVHYYQVHFLKSFSAGSFCDISRFWNCDSAAFSPLGNIFNVPTSLFGLAFGLMVLFGALVKKPEVTRTNFFLALFNLLGCIFLFVYSLLFLGGLCPACTIYYVLSLATVFLFFFMSPFPPMPKISILLMYGFLVAVAVAATLAFNYDRFKKQDELITEWVKEMHQQTIYDDLRLGFLFPLVKSTEDFSEAPLRITIFSDFQCPFCKLLGKEVEKVAKRYAGRINIQYMFFPLDVSCNKKAKTAMHPLACAAARLSYCAKDNFQKVHDDIYAHQESLTNDWLLQKAKTLGVKDCYENEESKTGLKAVVDKSDPFDIDSVPVMFINGRKVSGLIPTKALIALLDAFINK
jgi:uncharacterized membrane protein